LGADEVNEELLHGVGAAKLVDKMDLSDQLIPAILELRQRTLIPNSSIVANPLLL